MTDIHKTEGADLAASRESSAPSPVTLLDLPVRWFWLTRDGHLTLLRPEAAAHD